jgi:hypothetical protein
MKKDFITCENIFGGQADHVLQPGEWNLGRYHSHWPALQRKGTLPTAILTAVCLFFFQPVNKIEQVNVAFDLWDFGHKEF